jgi:hypothetical protein
MSCLNYNPVLNCASSPRRFWSRDCKIENVLFYWNWLGDPIMTLFPMDGVLLEVRNRRKRRHAWSLVATTSHARTLSMLFFQDLTDTEITFFIPSYGYMTLLCLCISNSNQVHFWFFLIIELCPLGFPSNFMYPSLPFSQAYGYPFLIAHWDHFHLEVTNLMKESIPRRWNSRNVNTCASISILSKEWSYCF